MNQVGSRMLAAVRGGDLNEIRELVCRHGLPEPGNQLEGLPLLIEALWNCHQEIAMFLLNRGAEVNHSDTDCFYGCLPLHLACRRGYLDMVETCVRKGANVNLRDNRGRTPLYYSRDIKIAECLLANGAAVNIVDTWGYTPSHCMLIAHRVDIDEATKIEMMILFVEYGADPVSRKGTLLHELLEMSVSRELLEAVLIHHRDIEARSCAGETALHCAVRCGRIADIEILVEKGADVNARDASNTSPLLVLLKKPSFGHNGM